MSIQFTPLRLREIRDETPDAYSLVFDKPEVEAFHTYKPGQYLTLRVQVGEASLRRAFSLSSSPHTDDHLSVTIKRVPDGRVSNYLRDTLQAGDTVESYPPMGNFTAGISPENHNHYVLIGAGSGITPLYSILKTVLESEPNSRVSLWYCNRDEQHIIFKDALEKLRSAQPDRLKVYHTLTRPSDAWEGPTGRLDRARINELLVELFMRGDERTKRYYLCGPEGLMDAAEAALADQSVNPASIHREYYSAPAPGESEIQAAYGTPVPAPTKSGIGGYELKVQRVRVEIDGKIHSLDVKPDQYVLDAAIDAQLDPPFACQSGICTTCRAMLRSGVVSMDESEGLSEDEIEEGFVLTCQCHPLTDSVELVYQ